MNKLLFLLLILAVAGCQIDDIKNTYTIRGTIGSGYNSIEGLSVTIFSGDHLVDTYIPEYNFIDLEDLFSGDHFVAASDSSEFSFNNLEEGNSYIVLPRVAVGSSDGLTALDLVMIRKYVEGQEVFNAFQKLAADINRDGFIDQEDIDDLGNCLLGGQCPSWRFASQNYDGSGSGIVDQFYIKSLKADQEVNFVAIKLGNVSSY